MRPNAAGRQKFLSDQNHNQDENSDGAFEFPTPPDIIPDWADREASKWRRLDKFNLEVKAEEHSGLVVEIRAISLPESVWGLHVARGNRVRLCVNNELPPIWRRFATFHELYHLIAHSKGEHFWSQTFQPISKFESEADLFAWAAIWPEWTESE
jgi:Zn-dependent peptidase ImmA (M78 family)